MARAEQVGNAFLVAPADELQRVGRIDIVWRGKGPLVDAGGPEAAALRRVEIDQAVARLDEELEALGGGARAAAIRRSSPPSEPSATRCSPSASKLDAPWKAPDGQRTSRTA